ncbi:MAG: PEP-CTERM system histidine kinase PrsK [Candidatus Andeanibacterium colombiense]|uniref:histidine kinase n=1 Tax=Candidatus Andeanibacterium colombiense TaxID=3121345 RepID=A0AAJ5X7I9_9SPHN|nr:MAG: PEP-CTERM system histidine kinase PrsK [Sphingomonadaceae bacterium]
MTGTYPIDMWSTIVAALHLVGAVALLGIAGWLFSRREKLGPAGQPILAALGTTAFWGLAVAAIGQGDTGTQMFLSLSYLTWFWALYRLFANDGRHQSVRPIRTVVWALAFVEMLQFGLIALAARFGALPGAAAMIFDLSMTFRLLCAVGALVLVHNLYVGASSAARLSLRWPAAALAAMWLYDLNFYTVAYLTGRVPQTLADLRALVMIVMAILLAIGTAQADGELRLRASRSVAFQSFSLLLIGGYLVGMVLVAQGLAYVGSDFARLLQLGFLVSASVAALLVLPSRRLRGWIRVVVAKHLFQHRYDYRAEWLRFTETIARGGEQVTPLHERVVRAIADITDSPAGLLLTTGEEGSLSLDSRWQWPEIAVPGEALDAETARFFERERFILDLDDVRDGRDNRGEGVIVPAWLRDHHRAWAMIPLLHYQRLIGIVVLARPPIARRLDWEDFDLLRVVGQQLASYLAEQAGQEALGEAHRFDEFNRRIAFVMHDIKNLASQLSLLARNAEKHAEKPEFRADMLVTLRNSSDKLNALLARLGRYGAAGVERPEEIDAVECVTRVVRRYEAQHPVMLVSQQPSEVLGKADSLEQALVHLVQNAIDASDADSPVLLSVRTEGLACIIEVIDSGSGMSAEFIRSRLFKPFHSSKPGGFGIGAFEARELIRAMNGRLDVESREGVGTRFILRLPLATSAGLRAGANQDLSRDVA